MSNDECRMMDAKREKRRAGHASRTGPFDIQHSSFDIAALPARLFSSPSAEVAIVEAAAAATTATPSATAATPAKAPFGLRTRFVHHQRTTFHLMFVEFVDGFLRIFIRGHLDESKPARAAGGHVAHHADAVHLAGTAEELRKLILGG
jgi:hypothetical protein